MGTTWVCQTSTPRTASDDMTTHGRGLSSSIQYTEPLATTVRIDPCEPVLCAIALWLDGPLAVRRPAVVGRNSWPSCWQRDVVVDQRPISKTGRRVDRLSTRHHRGEKLFCWARTYYTYVCIHAPHSCPQSKTLRSSGKCAELHLPRGSVTNDHLPGTTKAQEFQRLTAGLALVITRRPSSNTDGRSTSPLRTLEQAVERSSLYRHNLGHS